MNLLIYSRLDFTFKANLPIESFEIVLDTVINSESSFVISGSGGNTAQEDIAILHERSFFYIGIVKKISAEGIKTKINTSHFNSILETEYLTINFPLCHNYEMYQALFEKMSFNLSKTTKYNKVCFSYTIINLYS